MTRRTGIFKAAPTSCSSIVAASRGLPIAYCRTFAGIHQPHEVAVVEGEEASSRDFFEMAEAQGLDHLRLDRRDVLVGLVGTKRRANDGAGSAAALGLTHELGDGLRDIVRIRGVLALKP